MRRRGFTYIELVTVWAIIAILAAILFPVFARARAKAQQCNCLRNLSNIGVALRVYAQDWYGHFPAENNNLTPLLAKALPDARALICPGAKRAVGTVPPGEIGPEPPAGACDFVYWGGACDDDKPNFTIAADDQEDRHNDGANYLWVDGHVKWMSREKAIPALRKEPLSPPDLAGGLDELQRLRELKPGYVPAPPVPPGLGVKGRL